MKSWTETLEKFLNTAKTKLDNERRRHADTEAEMNVAIHDRDAARRERDDYRAELATLLAGADADAFTLRQVVAERDAARRDYDEALRKKDLAVQVAVEQIALADDKTIELQDVLSAALIERDAALAQAEALSISLERYKRDLAEAEQRHVNTMRLTLIYVRERNDALAQAEAAIADVRALRDAATTVCTSAEDQDCDCCSTVQRAALSRLAALITT